MNRGGGASIFLSRRRPEGIVQSGCDGTVECLLGGAADGMLMAGWLLLMVVVAVGSLVFLPRARELCDRERQRTRAEFDAMDGFIGNIRDLPTGSVSGKRPVGDGGPVLLDEGHASSSGVESIRGAYEETVMDVDHYDEDYGEPVYAHMRAELGAEIAEAVRTEPRVTAPLQRSVMDAATAARARRERFLGALEDERSSLTAHDESLRGLATEIDDLAAPLRADQSFDALQHRYDRLQQVESRIEALVEERQSDRSRTQSRMGRAIDLQAYLYGPMDPTYPVLAEATNLLARIRVPLERVEDELIYRV